MRKTIILCLMVGLGLTASCDYSSYRKSKDAEKENSESSTQKNSEENSSADTNK